MSSKFIFVQNYISPVGELLLGEFNNALVLCDWKYRRMRASIDTKIQKDLQATYTFAPTSLTNQAIEELKAYFLQERTHFTIPLAPVGTPFQKTVWQSLLKIPFGETTSYQGLSKKLGNEAAIRAVASANGANALSIFIPCHRVIGSNGELTGYAGGLPAKKKLLQLENALPQLELF